QAPAIEHVERLPAELDAVSVERGDALAQRHVEIPIARIAQRVLRLLSERAGRGRLERVAVEPHGVSKRGVEIGTLGFWIAHHVIELLAAARSDAGDIHRGTDIEGRARRRLQYPGDIPPSEHPAH